MIDSWLGRRLPFVTLAWQNLTRARARSILAMAGITIGVIAIASLGMFGAAYEESLRDTYDNSMSQVYISPGEDGDFESLEQKHIDEISRNVDGDVHPVGYFRVRVAGNAGTTETTMVTLNRPEQFYSIADGEVTDNWRSGVLVGSSIADSLSVTEGDSVTVDGKTRRVVGVLEESGRGQVLPSDDAIVAAPAQASSKEFQTVIVRASGPEAAFETSQNLERALNGRNEIYDINDAEEFYQRFQQRTALMNTMLLGIGAISLLVASVSILNVMLMSTIERKEEIGVMRAVGYHRFDILRLMLSEAALLGFIGALVGVVLSIIMGMAINDLMLSEPLAFTTKAISYVVLGFLFGTVASFLSGLYPAWKAANARPVEALRD